MNEVHDKNCASIRDVKHSNRIATISLVISLLTFLFTFYPQLKPNSADYQGRAEAGEIEAQMFLAHHAFEIGDYGTSIYWYGIAAKRAGNHQSAALNNEAYVGLTYGFYDYTQDKVLRMFKEAANLGNEVAVKNMFYLLKEADPEAFTQSEYERELAWVIQVAFYFGIPLNSLSDSDIKWALEQFHFDRQAGIVDAEGTVVYPKIGIFPDEDAFEKYPATYVSYEYKGSK